MANRTAQLRIGQAVRDGWRGLRRCPGVLLGFSGAAFGLHLLGWALFAAGHQGPEGWLALLLDGAGIVLYVLSLVWLIQGLTRAGLALAAGQPARWRALRRWRGGEAWQLLLALGTAGAGLALAALFGFVGWSLVVFLLPALSLIPALLALVVLAAVALSQLFLACLVIEAGQSPSRAFRSGLGLLEPFWPSLLALAAMAGLILLLPFGLGLLAEAALPGLGAMATALALVAALPVLSGSITAAYRQLEARQLRAEARSSGAAGETGWPDSNG
jgi:hypothetical protein